MEYAEVNGIGFNIDIVPGVAEADDVVQSMINAALSREEAELAVAITDKKGQTIIGARVILEHIRIGLKQ